MKRPDPLWSCFPFTLTCVSDNTGPAQSKWPFSILLFLLFFAWLSYIFIGILLAFAEQSSCMVCSSLAQTFTSKDVSLPFNYSAFGSIFQFPASERRASFGSVLLCCSCCLLLLSEGSRKLLVLPSTCLFVWIPLLSVIKAFTSYAVWNLH